MTAKAEETAQAEVAEVYQAGTAMALELIGYARQAGKDLAAIGPKGRMVQAVAWGKVLDAGMKAWLRMVDLRHASSGGGGNAGPQGAQGAQGGASSSSWPWLAQGGEGPEGPLPRMGTEEHPLPQEGRARVSNAYQYIMSLANKAAREEAHEEAHKEEATTVDEK